MGRIQSERRRRRGNILILVNEKERKGSEFDRRNNASLCAKIEIQIPGLCTTLILLDLLLYWLLVKLPHIGC